LDPFVVVEVDIFSDKLLGLFKSWQGEMAQIFFFEMAKEVFGGSIIPTIARPGHGRDDVILGRQDMLGV